MKLKEKKQIIIHAPVLYDGETRKENVNIIIENEQIIAVTTKSLKAHYTGYVTPAFIDAHSHIGMHRYAEPDNEGEANDYTDQILPLNNALNSIYFDDKAFEEAVDFGVLYSCVVPGSGNLIGGKAVIIKNYAQNRNDAFIKEYGYKMALGYNPRSTQNWKGTRPNTRMGIYSLLEKRWSTLLIKLRKAELTKEKKLEDLKQKSKKEKWKSVRINREKEIIEKEYKLEFDMEDYALLDILINKKKVKVHVHKEDDILYLLDLVKKYKINITVDHAGDVHHTEIFNQIADANIPVVYGPLGSLPYKTELTHDSYKNVKMIMESRAYYGLMTDHPVILTSSLKDTLKYFLMYGMSEAKAISLITYHNARILGLDNKLGRIKPSLLASLIVWDNNPFYLGSSPLLILAEGRIIRKKV